ncbi:tRNAPhe (7-(3-amino-3-carboxypropyl)wyosine37-C2)-hydroxylase [Tyrophagus putrescentiae]|nr:tRNAPhe (7-(3-amino-3-carboxypropyl)wyosine37-C2)-hydroxylase [Tyrophagus putrescentiae]
MAQVQSYSNLDQGQFDDLVSQDFPFIISDCHFGSCLQKWNAEYLSSKLNGSSVKVHVSEEPVLNFLTKNFRYETQNFGEFLQKCAHPDGDQQYLYLRSIGVDKRGRDVADIQKHFPQIADDLVMPPFANFCTDIDCEEEGTTKCTKRHLFSSVFRISSKELVVWTHYDMVDNILLQVKGEKRVTLFPPSDAPFLYIRGDKSEIADLDQENIEAEYPLFSQATRLDCHLGEGDAIFIPALWFHTTKALQFSIGVNFFWKDRQLAAFYNRTDVYGNKDLIPAADAYSNVDKALKHLSKLPPKYRQFYLHMIIARLNKELTE